jgi:hypothetical protein
VHTQDLVFGTGQVILIDFTDGFEEPRADFVVQIFRKEVLRICRQALTNVLRKICVAIAPRQVMNDET